MPTPLKLETIAPSPELAQNSPETENRLQKAKADLADLALGLFVEKSPNDSINGYRKVAELVLGEKVEGLDQGMIERVATFSMELGVDYDAQRPEIKLAIAELPVLGKTLEKDANGEVANNGQEITAENIAFVRTTDYLPPEIDGARTVLTAFNATRNDKNPVFRLTSHWTANHVVHNHSMGEFEGRNVTIIAPAVEMLKENGIPEAMLPVDTFWNNDIRLPENSVIITYENAAKTEGVIQLKKEDDSETITTLALKAMGYSTVQDHPTYTENGFDRGVIDLGKKIGVIESKLHIDMRTKETAIENFFHPGLFGEQVSKAFERMAGTYWTELPTEVQEATMNRLVELANMDISPDKKHPIYNGLDYIINDYDKKYTLESRKAFITALPYEAIADFVKCDSVYWESQHESTREKMIEFYINGLAEFLDNDIIEKLKKDTV